MHSPPWSKRASATRTSSGSWEAPSGGRSPRSRATGGQRAPARPYFSAAKDDYYLNRVEELEQERLLPVGKSVAEAFLNRPALTASQLQDAVESGLGAGADPPGVDRVINVLRDLGFVWRVEGRMDWEPGIPSLMDYTHDQAG